MFAYPTELLPFPSTADLMHTTFDRLRPGDTVVLYDVAGDKTAPYLVVSSLVPSHPSRTTLLLLSPSVLVQRTFEKHAGVSILNAVQ